MLAVAYDTTVSARVTTGVGVYSRELLAALRSRALDVREWRERLAPSGVWTTRLGNGARLAHWYWHGVHDRTSREPVAVYHSTTSFGPLRRRCPIVITLHDATAVTMPYHRGRGDRAFRRLFSVQAARRAEAILAPTRAAADEIAAAYGVPVSRIQVAHLGVAAAFHQVTPAAVEQVRARYGLPFPYVLYVGAEPPRKNLARLVEAFAAVASRCPDVHLVLAGPGRPRDHTVDAYVQRARLDARVHRLNVVTRDDLPAIYAGAACLAFVSLCEGFGLPVVEAMAAGTPVVTSNRSSMPEVAGDAALLVDPSCVDAIADGISRVLEDNELAEALRRKGRIRSTAFDWSATAAATERVYRAVSGA